MREAAIKIARATVRTADIFLVNRIVNARRRIRRPVVLHDAIGPAADIIIMILRPTAEWRQHHNHRQTKPKQGAETKGVFHVQSGVTSQLSVFLK